MCCFSGSVSVSGTNIFCRHLGAKQVLAYDMRYASDDDIAMILPLPVPPGSGEKAVRFIDLSGYDDFFDHLHAAFEIPTRGGSYLAGASLGADTLEVHSVGAFDASFVPSRKDFARLDARFRFPENAWASLPQYADWGFAVFKLKAATMLEPSHEGTPAGVLRALDGLGTGRVHPMAFEFPTRAPDQVFFPTVHVHDGQVHEYATFDHWLFLQLPEDRRPQSTVTDRFAPAERSADACVDIDRAKGLVSARDPLWRLRYSGEALNEDIWSPIVR